MTMVFPATEPSTLPVVGSDHRFPVRRIYCVGRNYSDHAIEMGADPNKEPPFFFTKPADAVVPPNHPIKYPSKTEELHHEVELVVALERGGTNVSVDAATAMIFGYAVGLDLTRRDLQKSAKEKGHPWCTAKAFDHSAVVGAITSHKDCGHLNEGLITLKINQELKQSGNLNQMIWRIPEIISKLSEYFSLQPGDLIFTGTPAGVGALERGDKLEAKIDKLSVLVTHVE
ncbi:fumarylacetoacetate hydrolase family protein [Sessilibacter sp. MAH2]